MEDIKAALILPLSPESIACRCAAYSSLVQLQKQEDWDTNSALCAQSTSLLSYVLSDIFAPHEEIATQALKCLGFMVYHPSLVQQIPGSTARVIVESLSKLATTTQMKAVCSLSVWCISMQQFEMPIIDSYLHHVIRAIVYALDNPFGSLSTTYEAMQAVLKCEAQLRGKMEAMECIWLPPMYKRLLSSNKKEREMTERCLLQIKTTIFPPSPSLSQVVAADLKSTLLERMMEMLEDHSQKIVAIRAWKWYVHLLWSDAPRTRLLVNKMLKIPGRTFSDPDPSVQMATLASWESLIDALLADQNLDCSVQNIRLSSSQIDPGSLKLDISRRIILLAKPLIRLVSSHSETSACSSCFITWSYLLQKLDILVNHPSVKESVVEPFLESVFSKGLGTASKNKWLWDSCVTLLYEFVTLELKDEKGSADDTANSCNQLNIKDVQDREEKSLDIKWLPWKLHDVTYILKMIQTMLSQGLTWHTSEENRILVFGAALRIFRSLLKGIQFRIDSTHENTCQSFIEPIFGFLRKLCESVIEIVAQIHMDLLCMTLHFLEAIREELEPSILSSTCHKILLDISFFPKLNSKKDLKCLEMLGIESLACIDLVSPLFYLNTLYFCTVSQFILKSKESDTVIHTVRKSRFTSFSFESLENLQVLVSVLYTPRKKDLCEWMCLIKLWEVVAENTKDYMEKNDDIVPGKFLPDGYILMQKFLCYLFSIGHLSDSTSIMDRSSWLSSQPEVQLKSLLEIWKTLVESMVLNLHSWGFEKMFRDFVCSLLENLKISVELNADSRETYGIEFQKEISLSVFDATLGCILLYNQLMLDAAQSAEEDGEDSGFYKKDKHIGAIMELIPSVLRLTFTLFKVYSEIKHDSVSRISSMITQAFSCFYLKEHIEELIKTISDPLVLWFSSCDSGQEKMASQVQSIWKDILTCLQKSRTIVAFDCIFLGSLSPLLEVTLNHAHPPISSFTISFWKSIYDGKFSTRYPKGLHLILTKLAEKGLLSPNHIHLLDGDEATVLELDPLNKWFGASTPKYILEDAELELVAKPKVRSLNAETPHLSNTKRLKLVDRFNEKREFHDKTKDKHSDAVTLDWNFHHLFESKKEHVREPGCILGMLRR